MKLAMNKIMSVGLLAIVLLSSIANGAIFESHGPKKNTVLADSDGGGCKK